MDFKLLLKVVNEKWQFTVAKYPSLNGATPEQIRMFAIEHVLRHMHKSIGRVEGIFEDVDHGGPLDNEGLKFAVKKMLINQLQLCGLLDITPEEIYCHIEQQST